MAAAIERPGMSESIGLPSRCREGAPAILSSSEVGPELPRNCPAAAEQLSRVPNFGSISATVGRCWPMLHRCWPDSAPNRPTPPRHVQCWPHLGNIGQHWSTFASMGQQGPTRVNNLANLSGQAFAKILRQDLVIDWPTLTMFGPLRPTLASIGETLANIGQHLPELGRAPAQPFGHSSSFGARQNRRG